jgi:glutamine synthetase
MLMLEKPKRLSRARPSASDVVEHIRSRGIKLVDIQFTDVPGRLQHFTVPSSSVVDGGLYSGLSKVDGSSIRGFLDISESDAVAIPDPTTFAVIPWRESAARLIADIYMGGAGRLERDPRHVAQRAESYLRESLGFSWSFWGPEMEFFIFDNVTWWSAEWEAGYSIESSEASWRREGRGYKIRYKEGYYPAEPQDTLSAVRDEIVLTLQESFNVDVEAHHHEVATAGQAEVDMVYDTLTRMADNVMTLKYVAKNVAARHGKVATFMPKPLYGDNASGMHVHVSLWGEGSSPDSAYNAFYDQDDEYAEISQVGRYFIGGLLEHAPSLAAIVAPTTNSYKRLVPGYEAPVYLTWGKSNRSAAVRVPSYYRGAAHAAAKRVEFRVPDPSSNPYLAFSAILMAGIDGVRRKMDPGSPVDENVYHMGPERRRQLGIRSLPGSLRESLEALRSDNDYLRPVFERSLIDAILENAERELLAVESRPHPYEFHLYFDI